MQHSFMQMFCYEWSSDVKFLTVEIVRNLVNILDSVKRVNHLFVFITIEQPKLIRNIRV